MGAPVFVPAKRPAPCNHSAAQVAAYRRETPSRRSVATRWAIGATLHGRAFDQHMAFRRAPDSNANQFH
jgi:hypothetical protein